MNHNYITDYSRKLTEKSQEKVIDVELGINETTNATAHSSMIITLMNSLPLFIWLVVLIAVVALITGRTT